MSDIAGAHKVLRINRMIDKLIVSHTESLTTLVTLKRSIEQRMFNGQLHQTDLEYIKENLMKLDSWKVLQMGGQGNGLGGCDG